MAIQLIINREWGLAKNENPNQGAFIIDELTELVEEAVLAEFEKIAERGGVLGAMETGYQRGKIQEESMHYEMLKHTGEYPIIGVNTFRNPHGDPVPEHIELARSTDEEKQSQLTRLRDFHARHAGEAPAMLKRLQQAVIDNRNVFEVLMDAVRVLLARARSPTRCSRSAGSTGAACSAAAAIPLATTCRPLARDARGFDNPRMSRLGATSATSKGLRLARQAWQLLHQDSERSIELAARRCRRRSRTTTCPARLGPAGPRLPPAVLRHSRRRPRPSSRRRSSVRATSDRAGHILAGTGLARCLWREGRFAASLELVLPLRDEGLRVLQHDAARHAAEHDRRLLFGAGPTRSRPSPTCTRRCATPAPRRATASTPCCTATSRTSCMQLGDYHEALRYVDQGIARCTRLNNPRLLSVLLINRVICLTELDRPHEAMPDVRRCAACPPTRTGAAR